MTTPPKAKLYHTRRDETVVRLPGAGDPAGAVPEKPVPGTEAGAGAGPGAGAGAAAKAGTAAAAMPAPPSAQGARVEVVRRPGAAHNRTGAGSTLLNEGPTNDGFGDFSLFPKDGQPGDRTGPAEAGAASVGDAAAEGFDLAAAIEAVKAEKITARRLRIAERIAALHQIEAASPEEAVARLRQHGIDPFHREALRRAVADEGARANARPTANLPSVVPSREDLPAKAPRPPVPARRPQAPPPAVPEDLSEAARAAEIIAIQRDIARRRRRRLSMLFARLSAFVFIPTIVAGWYYFTQATPLYATFSQFQVQQANSAASGGLGSLFSGTQMATNPESVAIQSYLTSRDAMLRLDEDMGFKRAYQDPAIDPLTRLSPAASNEEAFGTYKSSVKIGYDPTEGVINMEVVAPDPQLSRQFSLALIKYAEEQVDQMTGRLRNDQLTEARQNYDDAQAEVMEAQRRVQELQERVGMLDPMAESGAVMGRVGAMEAELVQKRLDLGTLESNARPNASRVDALKGEIARLEEMISQTRLQLTESTEARNSLAAITGELRLAEAELATRHQLLASTLGQLESARVEANKQVRYLTLSVAPVAPDEATYPRAGQNTFVALLIFSGIYLMISLTVSILREQVSS